jgi:hypothetical protein
VPDATVTNPAGANRLVADFTTWVDGYGAELNYDQEIATYRANAALARGDCAMFVAPTTTVPLSVTGMTGSSNAVAMSFAGVALDPIAAGAYGRICIRGYCRVQVGTATPAAYDALTINGSATGAAAVVTSASLAAATITGLQLGIFLGAKDGTNLAPCRLGRF